LIYDSHHKEDEEDEDVFGLFVLFVVNRGVN
jgi:hypothetical protein